MDLQHLAVSKWLLDAHTLLCQAIMPLIMQISTLLGKLLCSLPAFLSRKDIIILFNCKEMTCHIFLPIKDVLSAFAFAGSESRRGIPGWRGSKERDV